MQVCTDWTLPLDLRVQLPVEKPAGGGARLMTSGNAQVRTKELSLLRERPGFLFCRVHTMDTFQTKHIVLGGGVLLFPRSLAGTGDKLLCHVVIFLSLWILYRYIFSGLKKMYAGRAS